MIKGARAGFIIGIVVCVVAYILAIVCLPSQISATAAPGYCGDSVMSVLKVLTYPVSYFTNDLASAPFYAIYTIALYTVLGALIGLVL